MLSSAARTVKRVFKPFKEGIHLVIDQHYAACVKLLPLTNCAVSMIVLFQCAKDNGSGRVKVRG